VCARYACPHWRTRHRRAGELAIAIPDQELELSRAVAEVHQQIPCLLGHPGTAGVGGDAEEVDAAAGMLDHEQNIESVQHHRVHAKQVRGENAVCLGAQEFSPARPFAARCRIDTGSLQNRPHRVRRKLEAHASQFAMDPLVPQVAFSDASRTRGTNLATASA
jgi:hypothetical protein